jgi:hypothetical protein
MVWKKWLGHYIRRRSSDDSRSRMRTPHGGCGLPFVRQALACRSFGDKLKFVGHLFQTANCTSVLTVKRFKKNAQDEIKS